MSNCVNISHVDHLPNEQTILIRYIIGCTGLWYLSQMLTAYRGVCDNQWTVMFPNHQHPQHTDFPIAVGTPGRSCTFAWNYGGIPGIGAENFDSLHSYLLQLTIFEYNCFNTGQTGTTGGGATGGGPITGGGGTGLVIISGPAPTFPPPITGGNPPGTPFNVISGAQPGFGVPINPGQAGNPQSSGQPSGDPQFFYNSQSTPVYNNHNLQNIGNPTLVVTQGTSSVVTNLEGSSQFNVLSGTRPNNLNIGETQNPNVNNNAGTVSPAITTELFGLTSSPTVIINEAEEHPEIPGYLSNTIFNTNLYQSPPINQVAINNLMQSAILDLQTIGQEIYIGQPIVFSAYFQPPAGVTLATSMTVHAQNSAVNLQIGVASNGTTSSTSPLTCGGSVHSSQFGPGPVVLIARVYDSNNQIIGIQAREVAVSETNLSATTHSSSPSIGNTPSENLLNVGQVSMNVPPLNIELLSNQPRLMIMSPNPDATDLTFSSILTTDYITEDKYQLRIMSGTSNVFKSGQIISDIVASSDRPIQANSAYWYPNSHTVGLKDVSLSNIEYVLEIGPAIGNVVGDTNGKLYLSNNFKPREVTVTASATDLYAEVPFCVELHGLVIHGQQSGKVTPSTTIHSAVSTISGSVYFDGITLNDKDYYSIIGTFKGSLNPFTNIIYTSRYEQSPGAIVI